LDFSSEQGWPGAFLMYIWCPTAVYPTNLLSTLFSIIATCSFPVVSRDVCALYAFIFLVVSGENYAISLDFNCSDVWRRVLILLPTTLVFQVFGDRIDMPVEADAKALRAVSGTTRNQEQRFGDSLNRLM